MVLPATSFSLSVRYKLTSCLLPFFASTNTRIYLHCPTISHCINFTSRCNLRIRAKNGLIFPANGDGMQILDLCGRFPILFRVTYNIEAAVHIVLVVTPYIIFNFQPF